MTVKVIIFENSIRPPENCLGIVDIFENSNFKYQITIVDSNDSIKDHCLPSNVLIVRKIKAKEVRNATIIFGLPSNYFYIKIINIIFYKNIFINIGPGKITKAIGIHKHPGKKIRFKIYEFIKYLIPHNYYLAADFEDAMYLATSYGRDIEFYLPIGLPKSMHMAVEFSKKRENKIGILFAPTHRWKGEISTINKWLSNENFINNLTNDYTLFYNNHPDDDKSIVSDKVIKTSELQNSYWKNVDILVTDYSSISHDFLAAGGKDVINVISDLSEFEKHEGKSPLPFRKQFPGNVCVTQDEFIKAINTIKPSRKEANINEYSNFWIQMILNSSKL